MAIYYSQILNKDTRKILTGSFSAAGVPLKSNTDILIELKKLVAEIPTSEQKTYTVHSKNKLSLFFFKVQDSTIVSSIVDNRTTNKIMTKYFEELLKEYNKRGYDSNTTHYDFDDTMRVITDAFNKKYHILASVEELENTHSALVENLDTLIHRGENINNLKDLADKVSIETREMSRKVGQLKFNAKIEQYKIYGGIVIVLLMLLFLYFKVF